MSKEKILIVGSGGIGRAAALIIAESTTIEADVVLADVSPEALRSAENWIREGKTSSATVKGLLLSGDLSLHGDIFDSCSVLLDCSPGAFAPQMARLCLKHRMHYANLTEYVQETNDIMKLAQNADTGFILQTGLAPGYIDVLGVDLHNQFVKKYNSNRLKSLRLRVGALSQNTRSPHFYAFTWSPIGVATEYIKESVVVREGKLKSIPSLSKREKLILNGIEYEADFTSGGIADLPEALGSSIPNIDYKTIRYPGHYDWVLKNLKSEESFQINQLEDFMLKNIPSTENDLVITYVEVQGWDEYGVLRSIDDLKYILPSKIGNHILKAIQTTTAAPLVESARLLLSEKYKGPITQSMIDSSEFLNSPIVKSIYG